MDILSILEAAELPRTSVPICLRGTLVAEYEQLDTQLQAVSPSASLAGDGSAQLVARMGELRAEMLRHEVTFTFEALPSRKFSDLRAKVPEKKEGQPDGEWADAYHEWVCLLVATCCVEPKMTAEQVDLLSQKLSDAQWSQISNAAWKVNAAKQDVPFSNAAFVLSLSSAGKSRRQPEQEPPDLGSLAGSPSSEPSTSETTPAESSPRSPRPMRSGSTRTGRTSSRS